MKIIILAAGMGTRLGALTSNTPKSLIDLGDGRTLLETQLKSIEESKVIDEVVIVIGYCGEQIEAKMKKYKNQGMKIKTIYNPFYEISNNLMSLWLAKSEMNEDFLITNGDNLFEKEAFSGLVKDCKNGVFLTISKKDSYNDDDMKVIMDRTIEKVSKKIPEKDANAESVGLVLVSGERSREAFKASLEELARDKEYINRFWLEVFNRMIEKGAAILPYEINGSEMWTEVDFHGDLLEMMKSLNQKKLESLEEKSTPKSD